MVLTDMLKNQGESAQDQAIWTLGEIGPDAHAAIPALTELLRDGDVNVRRTAAEALKKIKQEKQ